MQTTDAAKTILPRRMNAGTGVLAALLLLSLAAPGARAADPACGDCHNPAGIPAPHDPGCRNTSCLEGCHPKHLGVIQHPWGPGTPLLTTDRTQTCNNCHNRPFDGVYHPYRINVLAGSPTIAGVIDLDDACGQCHGGGSNSTDNPPVEGAPYLTKTELGGYAANMHNDRPRVSVGAGLDSPNTLRVKLAATAHCVAVCDDYEWSCGPGGTLSLPPGNPGANASCAYATAGPKRITLTVRDSGVGETTVSRVVTVYAPDTPPAVDGTACAAVLHPDWSASITDNSTDQAPGDVSLVTVDWGDSNSPAGGGKGSTFTHTYQGVGTYNVVHKALDTSGQQSVRTCTLTVTYLTISGTVRALDQTGSPPYPPAMPVAAATVTVADAATGSVVRRASTSGSGTFSFGFLKPGEYTLTAARAGVTFPVPAATVTVGPSSLGNTILGTIP